MDFQNRTGSIVGGESSFKKSQGLGRLKKEIFD